ncbi:C4-dicarboxylic acid transporter DauA [Shewanella sedimentimangrovi]|uniref:C4-dicarboxylic acid transporter DauA n=1 Tax=Shewanella sedimentimangrovi TaxID=2814293 RepID=A0ABX7QY98_9GAMM|nr:C4-dicarboxylic acid transporter DauA [Shewanella sedimentimangrovi]QSX36214.1 C4-dicarboxylic acid transporter DauA [Shewanella sedimentimangrovi]
MPRSHLTSLQPGHALRESLRSGYGTGALFQDLLAGTTVGIIAIPLAMALAIASGVPPQYGLYTAIIAGLIIALSGGSRFSVSGPTAAFVVLLYPIASEFGLGGLLLATLMSGLILISMAVLRLGRFIQYIPEPVTLGFTAGIAVVIATLQLKDFLGLPLESLPADYPGKLHALWQALPNWHLAELLVASLTLLTLILWPRLKTPLPPHLPAILVGALLAWYLGQQGMVVDTIGSRFHYLLADGSRGDGIPPLLPQFAWPWDQVDAKGQPLQLSLSLIQALLPSAFAIAMLGAIESLLCAVVLDGMTGTRHSANSELLGQGLGNLIGPFFGAIPATAAIARSAANVRAGARSPLASIFHALVVLLALLALTRILAYIPMATMAALLMLVAWNMSEAPKALKLLRQAPSSDILVFLCCFGLTVVFDMVIAITVGIVLASLLFMKEIAAMTRLTDISENPRHVPQPLPADWQVYRIDGPLFFAAADNLFSELMLRGKDSRYLVLDWQNVSLLDAGGLAALERCIKWVIQEQKELLIAAVPFQGLRVLAKAGIREIPGHLSFYHELQAALPQHSDQHPASASQAPA